MYLLYCTAKKQSMSAIAAEALERAGLLINEIQSEERVKKWKEFEMEFEMETVDSMELSGTYGTMDMKSKCSRRHVFGCSL